jgi:hypothetical protein
MKKIMAVVTAWYLTFTSFWHIPSNAYVVATADKVCENPTYAKLIWTKALSKAYAKIQIETFYEEWNSSEYKALLKLWGKESAWNHKAQNNTSSAFGIPQLLNLDPKTPAPLQIERGLAYIKHRYDKPSIAWAHWRSYGWY